MIFKIIGIVLLCIIVFVLLLIALVLFVPVRYRVKGSVQDGINVKGSVSWLLHFVHVSAAYDGNEPAIRLRICGILLRLNDQGKPDDAHRPGGNRQKAQPEKPRQDIRNELQMTEGGQEDMPEDASVTAGAEQMLSEPCGPHTKQNTENTDEQASADGGSVLGKAWNRLRRLPERILQIINAVRQALGKFAHALRTAKDKAGYVNERARSAYEWWTQPDTKQAWAAVKRELKYQLRHICPRKFEADICFGTGDPASTGQLLGAIAVLYPFTKDRIHITPDFEKKRLEGTFDVRGRIQVYKFLVTVIRLAADAHVRDVYHKIKTRKSA